MAELAPMNEGDRVRELDEPQVLTPGRLLRMAVRRRWWLFLSVVVGAFGGCAAALLIPNQYQSEATILVTHQQVPEHYVTPNSSTDVREALLIMTDAILSRTRLLEIIKDFDLYPGERKHLSPEELVELIQTKITVEPMQKGPQDNQPDSFMISFTGTDPKLAQEVTGKLTMLFIQENLKTREDQSTGTTNFLQDRLRVAAVDLQKQESLLRDFKMRYLGELPEQQQGNLSILTGLQMQLQNISNALGRAREQQVYLQSLLAQYNEITPAAGAGPKAPLADPTEPIKVELARLRNERTDLLSRYTEKYPDVVKVNQAIKFSEALLATATKRASDATKAATGGGAEESADRGASDTATAQIKSQLEANRVEVENDLAYQKQLEERVSEYQGRLNATPIREAQLADLLRNYDLSKKYYDDLLSKRNESELATTLVIRQQGQQFRIIDQPSLPTKPSGPDHLKVSLGGIAAGLIIGVALAFFVESMDHSLRGEQDLRRLFAYPIMVALPALPTRAETHRNARAHYLEWVVGTTLCLMVCVTEYYVLRRG